MQAGVTEDMKQKIETLKQASYKLAEEIYKSSGAQELMPDPEVQDMKATVQADILQAAQQKRRTQAEALMMWITR